jgi:hypothetical protein
MAVTVLWGRGGEGGEGVVFILELFNITILKRRRGTLYAFLTSILN